MSNKYTFGIMWDSYTPAVEGQLIRDVMALQSNSHRELLVVVPSLVVVPLLRGLRVTPILEPSDSATLWILYQSTATPLDAPSHAKEVVVRDLFVPESKGNLNTDLHSGYYLPEQGRTNFTSPIRNKPSPSSVGIIDTYVVQKWG